MGRPLRYLPHRYAPVEVTLRTVMGLHLLKASPEVNELIIGVLGRALALYDVRLYDIIIMSNHLQYTVGPRDALALARFMGFLHGNIAKEVGKVVGWSGKFWSRRGKPINIVDGVALEHRTEYIYAHGVKEGLVESPRIWPGPSSVKARLTGEPLVGYWFNRTAEFLARARGEDFGKYDYATRYEIELCQAPCWEHLDDDQYTAWVQQIVETIEEVAADQAQQGKRFAGLEYLEAQDPLEIPAKVKRSPAPFCHGSTKALRDSYRRDYRDFEDAYREAAAALIDGVLDIAFPEGSFPRPRAFVTPLESLAPT